MTTLPDVTLTGPQLRVLANLADGVGPLRVVDARGGKVAALPARPDDRERSGWKNAVTIQAGGQQR